MPPEGYQGEDGFADNDGPKMAGVAKMPSLRDDPWILKENRTLALVKACETTREGDDDHAIIARAGRFLNFLQEGQ